MGGIMSDDKKDLTKITDLSEFIHEDDPDIDAQLTSGKPDEDDGPPNTPAEDMASLDDLDDDESSGFEEASFDSNDSDDGGFGDDSEDSTDFGDDSENTFGDSESDDENEMSFDSEDDNTFGDDSEDSFGGDSFGDDTEDNSFGGDITEEATDFSSDDDNSFGDDEDGFGNDSEDSDDDSFESDDTFGGDSDSSEEISFGEENSTEDTEEASFEAPEISEPELEPEPTPESIAPPPPKENFEEVKQFAKNISYGVVAAGGNPPYSLIIKNIRFKEDAEDILIILREHGLVNDGNDETMKQGLDNGSVLISQISEYSAIYLAHRMRRFDVELLIGLSEELHPSKTYDKANVGLVTKKTLRKNRKDTLDLSDKPVSLESILMATTPALENYVVKKYISIATEHRVVDESELEVLQHAKRDTKETEEKGERQEFNYFDKNEDELLADISLGLDEVYQELAAGLKSQCLKYGGNAVIGINFQLTPLVVRTGDQSSVKYKITASGNIVWVVDAGRPGLEL
jgi:hypothetical protein